MELHHEIEQNPLPNAPVVEAIQAIIVPASTVAITTTNWTSLS